MLTKLKNNVSLTFLPFLLVALALVVPNAQAATYSLSDNLNLVNGCSATVEIKIDTQGSNVMAGDSKINIKSNEVTVNQVSIGSPLPMKIFEQVGSGSVQLSGARLPLTGPFNGKGVFGYINFTPKDGASNASFTFSSDILVENNLVDDEINNVLTQVNSKTYTVKDRFNKEVDGIGFCTPDLTAPNIQFISPSSNSSNNPLNTNLVLTFTDNRVAVDPASIKVTVDGTQYTSASPEVTLQQDGTLYRMEINPANDFAVGKNVLMSATVCDTNTPANCKTTSMNFKTYTPTPPPPVCGDGTANYENGEQCDDGNTQSGDGCSGLCLFEIPVPPTTRGASCSDGLHNQGEEGIDCGGPCSNACPTCVDGIVNQNEESVDCGGPCPACGEGDEVTCQTPTDENFITICHYPDSNPENAQTLEVSEASWNAHHQKHGDTLGACPSFDLCSEALLLAAPDTEEKAIETATDIISKQGVVDKQTSAVEAPKVITEVISQIDICSANPNYFSVDFSNPASDTDGDGLSDRMECYAGTSPIDTDTDSDSCGDYEELNQYYSDPLDGTDCRSDKTVQQEVFNEVFITDPQPGWILGTKQPVISGKVPSNTVLVLVIATQSEQSKINALIQSIDTILTVDKKSSKEMVDRATTAYEKAIKDAQDFMSQYSLEFSSELMSAMLEPLPLKIERNGLYSDELHAVFAKARSELEGLKKKPIVAVASTQFKETRVNEFDAKNFEELSNALNDRFIYDLVATAYLSDGAQVSSKAVRFSVDQSNSISSPVPRTIGGKLITGETAFKNLSFGENAYAQTNERGQTEIFIDDERPTVTGETEFGSQVFAIWNSVVLASSVISDSEQGAFEVKAPRNLEVDVPHRVTLYAVKTEANSKIRSESVDVFFRIKSNTSNLFQILIWSFLLILLIILGLILRHQIIKRSAMKLFKIKKSQYNKLNI